MLERIEDNPTSQMVDGWIVRNDGPYGQNRLYCPHCHRHSGLHKPRPFCPWCGERITGNRDRYYGGYEPKGGNMKGFIDDFGIDRPACVKCKHQGKMTVEAPCYNCISNIDLATHKPNHKTEFAAFEPKEENADG